MSAQHKESDASQPAVATKQVTIDIRQTGARGDGIHDDTAAIQQAIDRCSDAGGGRVIVPRDKKPVLQQPIRKPGVGVWGRKLPVCGLYARNVRSLTLDSVTMKTTDDQDARPVIRLDNVSEVAIDNLKHSPLPASATVIERHND